MERSGALGPVSRRRAAVLVVAGVVSMALSAGVYVRYGPGGERVGPAAAEAAAPAVEAPAPAATVRAGDVGVHTLTYEPGQSSGWHVHTGLHAVAVLSGTLTVYDGDCSAEVYEPGESYVGGQELHLVRNETPIPTEMVVTAISVSGPVGAAGPRPAPDGCEIT
jgi:quercetin dioxygenase-like cupin family protein